MSTLVALPMEQARRHKKMLRDGSGEVWPDHAEVLFSKAIQEYDRQSAIASASSPYPPDLPSRNEFIVRYLQNAGLDRTKQQVASHIQQLKKRSSKDNASTPSPSMSYNNRPYVSENITPADQYYQQTTQQHQQQQQQQQHHLPFAQALQTFSSPITSIAIRVNDSQPLQVPTQNLTRPPANQYSTGPATLTGVSSPTAGQGLSIRIRLLVPPQQDAISHLASSRILAIVSLTPSYVVQNATLGNKISIGGVFLLEETDSFVVQGNQLYCPLRMSPQTTMMVSTQGPGLPITIQQTVYGGQTSLLKITYELVHAPQPLHNSSAMYQYPNAGPFTQF